MGRSCLASCGQLYRRYVQDVPGFRSTLTYWLCRMRYCSQYFREGPAKSEREYRCRVVDCKSSSLFLVLQRSC